MSGTGRRLLAPGIAAGAGILMVAGGVLAQQPTATRAAAQATRCTAAIAPQALKVQKGAVQLRAALSQAIGSVSDVSVQEQGSGVQVAVAPATAGSAERAGEASASHGSSARPASNAAAPATAGKPVTGQPAAPEPAASDAAPQVVWLSLDASVAKPGAYMLQLQGAKGTCSGKVTIAAASD